MKNRILSLLLAAVMLLSCFAFAGCENNPSSTDDTTVEETTVAEETTSAESESSTIKFIENGVAKFRVVRADELKTSDTEVVQAMKLRTQLNRLATEAAEIVTDWTKDGTHDPDIIEIIVGNCDYDEVKTALNGMAYGDYKVTAIGNKIVVLGFTSSALTAATEYVIDTFLKYKTTNEDGTTSVEIERSALEMCRTKDKALSALPQVDGGTFGAYYNAGDDCDEIIIEDATPEIYEAYIKKLEAAGYKQYVTKTITDNTFTTLYNENYTLNVGYYDYETSIRIISEPYSDATLLTLESENTYDVVTTAQISMIGLEYLKSDGTYASNGLSILIRLADGRFVVVDGGFTKNTTHANLLIKAMKSQSADYIDKTGQITVAGWIVTHSHGDHNGMINSCYSLFKGAKIKVEKFIVNFLSEEERVKSISAYSGNWTSTEGSSWTTTYEAATALGAEVSVAHVGADYWLANLRIEVLYTIESYAPNLTNALNTTSLIMKMTFTDPTTKEQTVYMSTGDATGPGFNICNKMYGDYLKSDIVQVAHHGYTTWGTENGTISAYIKMAPETLLWPAGTHGYDNTVGKAYNAVLYTKSSNPNYKETLVAGDQGNITIFPMPYKVGSATTGTIS